MSEYGLEEMIPNASGDDNSPAKKHLSDYYGKLGRFCDQAHEEARGLQKEVPEIKEIQNALDYLCGLQWKQDMPSYRSKPVSNEVLANYWETVGLLTDIKPTWRIKALGLDDYSQAEKVLNNQSRGWAKQNRFNQKMAHWTMFAMFTTAPAKLYWNRYAHGDSGDPEDADQTLEALPTTSLLRLGAGPDIQQDELTIECRERTLNWIRRRYPVMGKHVRPDEARSSYTSNVMAPVDVSPMLFQQLSPQMKRMMGGDSKNGVMSVFPKAEVREFWMKDYSINESQKIIWMGPEGAPWGYWVKPGQMIYPRGRVIVRANGVTLYDEPNPYYHRKRPYINMGLYDVPWQQYALSVLSPWMKQQDILNQMMAGLLDCVKKALRPALMAPRSAMSEQALRQIDSSKPNLKVSYNSNSTTAPVFSQPPNIGNYPLPVIEMIRKDMRRTSGADAMGDAAGKKQVPGSDTLDRIGFGRTTNIRLMAGNLETAVDEMGMMWTANALQFYDVGRRVDQLGLAGVVREDMDDAPGSMIPDGTRPESYVRRFHFACEKGSLLAIQRNDKTQVSFALRKNHDLSRNKLYEQLDWNINLKENNAELAEEAKQIAMAQAAAGAQPGGKGHK